MANSSLPEQPADEQANQPEVLPTGAPDDQAPAAAAAGGAPEATEPRIVDVWSRTQPKYRIRAVALLLLNIVLFCGLCVFTHWLHVARPFDFSWSSYAAPMKFWGEQTQNLNDFVLYPISVEQTPMHGVVLGLLMASIVAVPIAVAILYGFPYAMPFAAAVLIFAHLPWMAITLVVCCVLAAVKPFRLPFRFGAALVGMLPIILYLYLATRSTPQQIGAYASPDQQLLLAAPWILSILAACTMLGTVLLIARLVNYRPGAVAPVVAVMFATPAILFYTYVGFDEVSYRVLETEYGPRSQRFARDDLSDDLTEEIRAMLATPLDDPTRQQVLGVFAGRIEPLLAVRQRWTQRLLREQLTRRREAYEACRRFIGDHPKSRYVPYVLYMQAWVLDTRLDVRKTLPAGGTLRRELYSDYPHVQSEEAWRPLLNKYPNSPLAIAARLRLAQLHLRRGEVTQALDLLAGFPGGVVSRAATQADTQPAGGHWLRPSKPESNLGFEPEPYLREGQRLYELIAENWNDPQYATRPLQQLASLDPHRPTYRSQLLHLAQRYRDALLYDNLVVEWAATEPDRATRAATLEACIHNFPDGDAVAEAMFRLAELEVQARGEDAEAQRLKGIARLEALAERFPHTRLGREAAERLRVLLPQAEPDQATMVTP